jgi:hypothetical protein
MKTLLLFGIATWQKHMHPFQEREKKSAPNLLMEEGKPEGLRFTQAQQTL